MAGRHTERERCATCRYWVERCCHALARLDHADDVPENCHHFTLEKPRIFGAMEARPC